MRNAFALCAAAAAAALLPPASRAASRVYSVPAEIGRSAAGYTVSVDGADAPVTPVRCSAMPVDCVWPGHERDLDQTEICGLVRFAFDGETTVKVDAGRDFTNAVVRPLSRKVPFTRDGNTVTLTLSRPGQYSVEFDGRHRNLHVFADPMEGPKADIANPRMRYFGPGIHEAGKIVVKSDDVIFLDEGAWVRGFIDAEAADRVSILGRGVIDMSGVHAEVTPVDEETRQKLVREVKIVDNAKRGNLMNFRFCDDLRIEGVTMIDSMTWNMVLQGCRRVVVDNVKTVGNWRYNSDGFDLMNSRDVTIRNCFLRTFDDSIVIKGFTGSLVKANGGYAHDGEEFDRVTDVLVSNCVTWCDWGRNLEIGVETCAKEMSGIRFTDCDLVCTTHVAMDVQNGDCAEIRDVVFENIRVEYDAFAPASKYGEKADVFNPAEPAGLAPLAVCEITYIPLWSLPGERGRIRGVTFRDIDVTAPELPAGRLSGHDAAHRVDGVSFERIRLNGRDATAEFDAKVWRNEFAR